LVGRYLRHLWLLPVVGSLVACQAQGPSPTAMAAPEPSLTAPATKTQVPTPTAPVTPPSLPAPYQSPHLNPLDAVHTYVQDECEYLHNKWSRENAPPGTIAMVVMLHSINQGKAEGQDAISDTGFERMMAELRDQKFEAINMLQLAGFLENNARIPSRSVALIQDGRRYPDNFNDHFRPYWDQWGWPVVNAWDIRGATTNAMWEQQSALEAEGWVDHQVYGPTMDSGGAPLSERSLTDQLEMPLPVFQERFGKAPIAVIWPSGFDQQAARSARTLGYRLGFTMNPRGPLMFNWVPLADAVDTFRPSYFPEGSIEDPLMTLPRYWPDQVHNTLDAVRMTGKDAAAYAEQNKDVEMKYYNIVCQGTYGPIP
jgi:hypothetical protein